MIYPDIVDHPGHGGIRGMGGDTGGDSRNPGSHDCLGDIGMPKVAAIYLSHLTYPSYALMTEDIVKPGDYCVVQYCDERTRKKPLHRLAYVGAIEGRAKMQMGHASLPEVTARASSEQAATYQNDRQRYRQSLILCKQWANELNLNMKITYVEPNETENKLTFFFTADKRVDFRELVKKLSAEHKCRIELWQIGAREESKCVGGFGSCGSEYCCTRGALPKEPITLTMVRDQDIGLPPSQLTGACGRLRCCLAFEHGQYIEMGQGKPPIGSIVQTKDGEGIVIDRNLLLGNFIVRLREGGSITAMQEGDIKEFKIPSRSRRDNHGKHGGSGGGGCSTHAEETTESGQNAVAPAES